MVIRRGDIWWALLPEPRGSEPGYKRPVVIVQADDFNRSMIHTVIVASITTNLRLANAPGNVVLSRKKSRLPKESVVNVSQILTIDKAFLTTRVGKLPGYLLDEIDQGLRLSLALS